MEPFEEDLHRRGFTRVAGLDEAGRGALFGPVVAGAVVLDERRPIEGLRDSKVLTARRRLQLFHRIIADAGDWAVGVASAREIDRVNILEATRHAMLRAVRALREPPDHLLVDAVRLGDTPIPQTTLIRGDSRSRSIAAASIVAKVVRDELLIACGRMFPGYGLARNKGYGTVEHRGAILRRGRSPLHRSSFRVQGKLPLVRAAKTGEPR